MDGKTKLGEMLLQAGLITQEQLRMALDFQQAVGGRLGAIIVKLGFIQEESLIGFIARQQDLPVVDLEHLVIPENLVRKIPRKLIERHQMIPVAFKDGVLTVVASDPYDFDALEEIQLAVNCKIEIHLASRKNIADCIQKYFQAREERGRTREASYQKRLNREAKEAGKEPLSSLQIQNALISLLVEKGVVSEEELRRRAKELP